MTPPLSLYVHLPWCVRKCPYCDFNSHQKPDDAPRQRYVDAIVADIAQEASLASGRTIESIFLGGGTPSLFAPEQVAQILGAAKSSLDVAGDCEVTMEANPGTVERGDLGGFRAAGITRLSLGAQSFDAEMLAALGRIHGPGEIDAAYADARRAGFDSINIDLMFALPGQDLGLALADVERVCDLRPEHVSWYQLTLEPNTVFHARRPAGIPDEDLAWAMQEEGIALLRRSGYEHYEISAFAQPGFRCRHNLNYWTFGDYLAVGAGAHGKLTNVNGRVRRYQKPAHPLQYIETTLAGNPDVTAHRLDRDDIGFEFMLNALRLRDGFAAETFTAQTGLPLAAIEKPLKAAQADGLIDERDDGRWQPTALGFRFLNDLQGRFLT